MLRTYFFIRICTRVAIYLTYYYFSDFSLDIFIFVLNSYIIFFYLISKNLHIFSSIFAIHSFSPPSSFLLNVRQQQQHDTAVVGH